jgi:hypothetical protein
MITVRPLTKDNKPLPNTRVWLWRDDQKQWVVERFTRSIDGWIGNPELAYTHWADLIVPPRP